MSRSLLMATVALTLAASGAAWAQQRLQPGAAASGDLRQGDEKLSSGEFVDTWTFQGRAGDRVSLAMTSNDFDPYLLINGPGDFSEQNDDGPDGGTGAALDVRLPADGTYRVMATSYEAGEHGRYALTFQTAQGGSRASTGASRSGQAAISGNAAALLNARPRTATGAATTTTTSHVLQPGSTVREALGGGDPTLSTGEYADVWTFQARRGQTYTLGMSSSDFDPYLVVRGPGGLSEDNDDDPGRRGSRDSAVTFTAAADGEVQISATSYQSGESGQYSLSLEAGGQDYADQRGANGLYGQGPQPERAQPTAGATAIRVGESRDGRLGQGARTLSSGEYVNTFTLTGRQGQQLDLRLTSSEFDPYVQITGPAGFSAFNDDDADHEDSRDSRLIVTLPADGAYEIAATSYEAGESGRYRLSVADGAGYRPAATPDAPAPRPGRDTEQASSQTLRIGDTVGGTLRAGDTTLSSGEYVDTYTFQGRRGQRIAAELTSSAFDAYIALVTPSGETISNDDGTDGTNSLLDTALSEDGLYTVAVTSYAAGETGSYRFSVMPSQGSARQASVQGGARVFAIMVGVSDYGNDQNNLPYTDEDAVKLAETLRREGVLNPASVTLTNADATVAGVENAFRRVAQQAGPDDMFLFFFSGHGSQTEEGSTPVSALEPDGRSESIVLRDGQISDSEMARLFGTLRTRLSLLVLDSCFSGGFARNVVDRPGVMGLFSSEEDLTSAVAGKFEAGGYLAHFLRAGLSGDADGDGDTMVTAGELATYLRREFSTEVTGVEAETVEGQRNYQNLVIDRGGVQVDDVVLRLASNGGAAGGR
ncbi:hypothetical protein BH09PSE1_BH09PSE1_12530 [soil metagenome]